MGKTKKRGINVNWLIGLLVLGAALLLTLVDLLDGYVMQILMTITINIIIAMGLNLVNGYLGDFTLGHAGFMAIGAYLSSIFSTFLFSHPAFFILNIILGGLGALLTGLLVAIPSFKTRGDYLAIITLGFSLMVKSLFENIEALGGARGLPGIPWHTNLFWTVFWMLIIIALIRNVIYSSYGRGILAIREDETAAGLCSVNTRQAKIIAFGLAAFIFGVAGGLQAHLLTFINPNTFGLHLISEGLIMVYLGGIGSISGAIVGGTVWTIMVEFLKPLGVLRWVVGGILLVVLMIFKPTGIMGLKEFRFFSPSREREIA